VFRRHPDAQATFAGQWRTSGEEKKAVELMSRFGLAARCRFIGEVSGQDKIRAYQSHDIFVFPPVEPEGLPWVLLEAMSASLPVVTTDQGAIAELVEHPNTGLIVPPTAEQVAESICSLLDNSAAARAMGERGRKRVEAHFSEDAYVAKLIALFRQVAGIAPTNT
jgi:glycosyltransferase involved in cell wall biosynthesis